MNTAVVNIRVDTQVKRKAKRVAQQLGFSLSALINGYLNHLVRTKAVDFTLEERPSEYLLKSLEKTQKDIQNGRFSPLFDNSDEAIAWLNNPKAKYADQLRKKI